jgi:hypothetical protein
MISLSPSVIRLESECQEWAFNENNFLYLQVFDVNKPAMVEGKKKLQPRNPGLQFWIVRLSWASGENFPCQEK